MNLGERFCYFPPWGVSRAGLISGALRPQRGGDEWHNASWFLVIPFLGSIVWFPKAGFDRSGTEHVYAYGPDGVIGGREVDGCETCEELLEEMRSLR